MKTLDYIPDATYTEPGYIAPVPGLHGELRFVYKPLLSQQRGPLRKAAAQSDEAYAVAAAKTLVHHLVSWTLASAKDEPVAITQDALARLKPAMQQKLFDIMAGWRPSDIDPLWDDAKKKQEAELENEAIDLGALPGEIREGSDLKN